MIGAHVNLNDQREVVRHLGDVSRLMRKKLKRRIASLTDELRGLVREAAPVRTGKLRSEIRARVYSDNPDHVAGYVSVYAPGSPGEYPKAGALEYGRWVAPHPKTGAMMRLKGNNRRAKARFRGATKTAAFRYLRGPLAEMKPQMLAAIGEVVSETVVESNA